MSETDRKIFVRNLHFNTTEFSFASHFEIYGEIEDVVIPKHKNGQSKRFGFITFTQSSMAKEAVSASPHIIDGRTVEVNLAVPKGAVKTPRSEENLPKNFQITPKHFNKLYVCNLDSSITDWKLKTYFSKFGYVQNAYTAKNADKTSKGFGFVFFQSKEGVEKVQKNRPHLVAGREIVTMRGYPEAAPADSKKPSTKLFVLNYEDWIEVKDIEEYFGVFGTIIATAFKTNLKENTKHMELEFEDYDVVDKILLTENHKIKNCNLTVQKYLEKKPEEPKKENVTRMKTSKNTPSRSRSSSVPLDNLKAQNQRASLKKPSIPTTVNAPCAPPLEDLHNPGVNPSFQNYHPSQQQPSSFQSVSNATYSNVRPSQQQPTSYPSIPNAARNNHLSNQQQPSSYQSVSNATYSNVRPSQQQPTSYPSIPNAARNNHLSNQQQPSSYPSTSNATYSNVFPSQQQPTSKIPQPPPRPATPVSSLYPNDRFNLLNRIPSQSNQKKNESGCVVS